METPRKLYSILKQRTKEIFYRAKHAIAIFHRRFFTLAVPGQLLLEDDFKFRDSMAIDRGNCAPDGRYYSRYYSLPWESIPRSIKIAVKNYDSVLKMYLGNDYMINDANVWRNYSIPEAYRNAELFSQNWHYDKVVDFRNIQLFVLLEDVTEDDGPFEYVVDPDEHKIMPSVMARNNRNLGIETQKLTGKRGDTFLFSTGSTPHRAGVPAEGHHRDIFSIAFFPAYTKIGRSSIALLRNID